MNKHDNILAINLQLDNSGSEKIIRYFLSGSDVCIRFNGGMNLGYGIWSDNRFIPLNFIPSGIIKRNVKNVITQNVLLDVSLLAEEIKSLKKENFLVNENNLLISSLCFLIMPWHKVIDSIEKNIPTKFEFINYGIYSAQSDHIKGKFFRLEDVYSEDFKEKFFKRSELENKYISFLKGKKLNTKKEYEKFITDFDVVKPFITDTYIPLKTFSKDSKSILFESAHFVMKDILGGPYPYVLPFLADVSNLNTGVKKIGMFKPFLLADNDIELPSQIFNRVKEKISKDVRVGWLDIPMLKYAIRNGINELAMLDLHLLSGIDEIYVCTKYYDVYEDKEVEYVPGSNEHLKNVTKVYDSFPSWREDVSKVKNYEDFPMNLKKFVLGIEKLIGKEIKYISVGGYKNTLIVR